MWKQSQPCRPWTACLSGHPTCRWRLVAAPFASPWKTRPISEPSRGHVGEKGKTLGLPAPNARALALALSEGADYVTISDDLTALRKGLEQALALFRDHKDSA